ncbi:MAG: hypothetical protein F9K23_09715 [Bacteroidetes bacterium]|nr:MAG: hypothetical protein F9K23_09715 [Bacteroidota bacterium]
MDTFDLYREAKNHYDLLIPEKVEGLILLRLYDKFVNEEFTEERINEVIEKVHKDLGRNSQRNEYERNNAIVLKFQEFFIWRDEVKKTYKFKAYGIEFCENIKERLFKRYSPAEIKRIFDYLYHELLRHIEAQGLDFNLWYKEHFCIRNTEIIAQVEILDQQVSESVREFRKRIKEDNPNLFLLLEEIEISLNEIKEHASQLKEAFKSTYDIDYKLDDLIGVPNSQEFISNINEVMDFNSGIRAQLEQVSSRIDRIKPRIREFIYEFNQRDFDRKTGLFLNLLLNESKQIKSETGRKKLLLPDDIPPFQIYAPSTLPKFVFVPERDITPKAPVEIIQREVNAQRQNDLTKIAKQVIFERQRVQFWIKQAFDILNSDNELDYSPFFFRILTEENVNLSIAIKATSKFLRQVSKNRNIQVKIDHALETNSSYRNIHIWKMYIRKI